jgi:hypothetical protein
VHHLPVVLHPLHVLMHPGVGCAPGFGFAERASHGIQLLLHLRELLLELGDLLARGRSSAEATEPAAARLPARIVHRTI